MTGGSRAARGADLLLTAIAAASWAFLAMAGVAALGLHLLGADAAGSLGPMTAAVVVLAVGGSVTPSGSVEAFGLTGAGAHTTIDIAPLGVALVGALLLGWVFARSLRALGPSVGGAELAARAGAVVVLFLLILGTLAWAGSSTVTFDGGALGLPGASGGGPGLEIPGLGDIGDIGGGLTDRLRDLADAKASVGFSVRTGPSLLGGLAWVLGVLLITLLSARRAPLPRGWEALHRGVRPAASALRAVLVLAVVAGLAAAVAAASGDGHPGRVAGAALLGAPNGVWLGVPLGLFVPLRGMASGSLLQMLPHPLDDLLRMRTGQDVSVARLAELEQDVWLLPMGCGLLMLTAGVLTAARTPRGDAGAVGFSARCGLTLGAVTAVALPLLVLATRVKADASLSVLGIDAMGAGLELSGSAPAAAALGAVWGLVAGVAGGLLAYATGAAGRRAAPLARATVAAGGGAYPDPAYLPGPYNPSSGYRPARPETNPYLRQPGTTRTAHPPRRAARRCVLRPARPGSRATATGPRPCPRRTSRLRHGGADRGGAGAGPSADRDTCADPVRGRIR
ncbi:streptophobe family protein [Streptomyces griseocarneus]|uniref:streptophobe family protein n=1 Tax=Streptomyces griseocarneus TaxID=51201 RepID=UPI001F61C9D5|nr:streptophobe family protein [Streptomyces griseocarneus]